MLLLNAGVSMPKAEDTVIKLIAKPHILLLPEGVSAPKPDASVVNFIAELHGLPMIVNSQKEYALESLASDPIPTGKTLEEPNNPDCYIYLNEHSRFTDYDNAKRFSQYSNGTVKYCLDTKTFYVFDGKRWDSNEKALHRKVCSFAQALLRSAEESPATSDDQVKKASKLFNVGPQNNMLTIFSTLEELEIDHDSFNSQLNLFPVSNGVVNLITGRLESYTPSHYFTHIAPLTYDENAESPREFLKFLEEVFNGDQELINYVLRLLGYLLTGYTREQSFWILLGPGGNGKSVLTSLISSIMGNFACSIDPSAILKRASGAANSSLIRARDARVLLAHELPASVKLNEAVVKRITSGEHSSLDVREVHGQSQLDNFHFKLLLDSNFLPKLDWSSPAIKRRVKIIPFNVQFTGTNQDPYKADKLIAEKNQIFKLLVAEAIAYNREGLLDEPQAMLDATSVSAECDSVKDFITDCVVFTESEDDYILGKDLHDNYCNYCCSRNIPPKNITAFGRAFKDYTSLVPDKRTGRVRYKYIKLNTFN